MWSTASGWFEVAMLMAIFAVGNVVFGHFEEHKPKWKRVLKQVVAVAITVGLLSVGWRAAWYGLLAAASVAVVAVHGWWLPRNGVNGLTGEPRERYYELIGVRPKASASPSDRRPASS